MVSFGETGSERALPSGMGQLLYWMGLLLYWYVVSLSVSEQVPQLVPSLSVPWGVGKLSSSLVVDRCNVVSLGRPRER